MPFYIRENKICRNSNPTINKSLLKVFINSGIHQRIYGKNPSSGMNVYSTQDPYFDGLGKFIRNPDCWINGVTNISCFSPAQLSDASWHLKAGTLITTKHVLFAAHYTPTIISGGTPMIFVDENNNVIRRKFIQKISYSAFADICIGLLDSDVPSNIKIAKVLPKNYSDYIDFIGLDGIIGLGLNQSEEALTKACFSIDFNQNQIYFDNGQPPRNPYLNWSKSIVVGDSGNPVFFIIDNELVVLTTWLTPVGGPFISIYYDVVNNIINTLSPGEGYSLTDFDLGSLYNRLSSIKVLQKS